MRRISPISGWHGGVLCIIGLPQPAPGIQHGLHFGREFFCFVIPANAGIQCFLGLDPRLRGDDRGEVMAARSEQISNLLSRLLADFAA